VGEKRPARARKPVKPASRPADKSRVSLLNGSELTELRQLIRLVQRTGIGEIEVTSGGRTVRIAAATAGRAEHAAVVTTAAPPVTTAPAGKAVAAPAAEAKPSNTLPITSPMVGTFYRAPAPDAEPYVEAGDKVDVGQTVCIVEAMKLMNEIESEVRGRIVQILVENAQPVEFGQTLFLVEPV
jgi:acetyl-CoA carboxylase biotin carboxyl carrier protein